MKAQEIMNTDVVTIKGSATVAEAVALMRKHQTNTLIVSRRREGDAYGIVTTTDIVYQVLAYGTDPKTVGVFEIMRKPCIVVNPELEVEYVARLFADTGITAAPVIREKLLGLVCLDDLLSKSDFVETPREQTLEDEINAAREQARKICKEKGIGSPACAAAWDVVEELQAEASHQRAAKPHKTYFEEFCEENPDAFEARVYDT